MDSKINIYVGINMARKVLMKVKQDALMKVKQITTTKKMWDALMKVGMMTFCHTRFIKNINRAIIYAPGSSHAYI
jgi:hypothetical protein